MQLGQVGTNQLVGNITGGNSTCLHIAWCREFVNSLHVCDIPAMCNEKRK